MSPMRRTEIDDEGLRLLVGRIYAKVRKDPGIGSPAAFLNLR